MDNGGPSSHGVQRPSRDSGECGEYTTKGILVMLALIASMILMLVLGPKAARGETTEDALMKLMAEIHTAQVVNAGTDLYKGKIGPYLIYHKKGKQGSLKVFLSSPDKDKALPIAIIHIGPQGEIPIWTEEEKIKT